MQLRAAGRAPTSRPNALANFVPEAGARLVFVDGVFAPELSEVNAECGVRMARSRRCSTRARSSLTSRSLRGSNACFRRAQHRAPARRCGRDRPEGRGVRETGAPAPSRDAAEHRFVSALLVVAETGADCTLIEDYSALSEDAYLTNAVTEIAVAPNARLRHIKLQRERARLSTSRPGRCVAARTRHTSHRPSRSARGFRATT